MVRWLWTLVVALGAAVAPVAAETLVQARLVTDVARLDAEEPRRLGVVLEMAPEWHVYWRNPGDSGLSTHVELTLPDGWSAGELQWPAPTSFDSPGGLASYGYAEKAVLILPLAGPAGRATGSLPVKVSVSWLACRDRCELGGAELEISLPVAESEAAAGRELLDHWQGRVPLDARTEPPPFALRTVGGLADGGARGGFSIWLGWPDDPGAVELFPAPPESLGVKGVMVRTRGHLTRIDCELERLGGEAPPPSFPAVVVRTAADGARRAWQVDVPLRGP